MNNFFFFGPLNSLKIYHHNLPLRKLMHTFFHISLSGSSSSTLALASSAIESCNYNVHQHIRPIQNEKVKIKRGTWDDITYHNEIALKKSVNQMEENVFGVFRMTLDAHHVVPILEHFDPGPIRPCYHLCFGWELPDLHYYNSPHHIRTQAFMLTMIVWIQVLPGLRKGTLPRRGGILSRGARPAFWEMRRVSMMMMMTDGRSWPRCPTPWGTGQS